MEAEIIEILDKEKFTRLQAWLYKIKTCLKVFSSKHFIFIDVEFKSDFSEYNLKTKRFKLSHKGSGEILKKLGDKLLEFDAACRRKNKGAAK